MPRRKPAPPRKKSTPTPRPLKDPADRLIELSRLMPTPEIMDELKNVVINPHSAGPLMFPIPEEVAFEMGDLDNEDIFEDQ